MCVNTETRIPSLCPSATIPFHHNANKCVSQFAQILFASYMMVNEQKVLVPMLTAQGTEIIILYFERKQDSKIPSYDNSTHFGWDSPEALAFFGLFHVYHSILVAAKLEYYIIWNKDLGVHPTKTICFKLQIQQNNGCIFAKPYHSFIAFHVCRFEEQQEQFPVIQWKSGFYLGLILTPVAFSSKLPSTSCVVVGVVVSFFFFFFFALWIQRESNSKSCSFCLAKKEKI